MVPTIFNSSSTNVNVVFVPPPSTPKNTYYPPTIPLIILSILNI